MVTVNFPPSTSIGTQRILKILKFIDKKKFTPYILTQKIHYFKESIDPFDPYVEKIISPIKILRTKKVNLNNTLLHLRDRIKSTQKLKKKKQKMGTLVLNTKTKSVTIKKSIKKLAGFLEFPDQEADWIPFAIFHGYKTIKQEKIDYIFSSSPKHSCHLTTIILKFLTGKKAIIEFRDPWARIPWIAEKRSNDNTEKFKHLLITYLERFVIKNADKVICVTKEMTKDLKIHYPNQLNKFFTLYNGYDSDLQKTIPAAKLPKNRIIFSHIGSLYQKRNPEPIFHALKNLLEKKSDQTQENIIFQFIGPVSDDLKYILKIPKLLDIDKNVRFIQKVSYSKSLEMMANSNVLIVLQPFTKLQAPGKIFDYMNTARPIFGVGEKGGAVDNLIRNRFGVFTQYTDLKSIETGIDEIIKNHETYHSMVINNRKRFDFSILIKQFETIILDPLN